MENQQQQPRNPVFHSFLDFITKPTDSPSTPLNKKVIIDEVKKIPAKNGTFFFLRFELTELGMSFDFTYLLGRYECAFTYKIEKDCGVEFLFYTTTGKVVMCLGMVMDADNDGEVHVMNCDCVRLSFGMNNYVFDQSHVRF
jgi:hypothetical protein